LRILGLVPARGGSKGVPGKNLAPLAGMSLVRRAALCARESGVCDRLVLSSEDPALMAEGRAAGLEVPFQRPAELAGDTVAMIDVVLHALDAFERSGYAPDAVMLLQPTSPLRRPEHLRRAVALLPGNDAVCSVVPLPREHCPHYVMRIDDSGHLDFFLPEAAQYTRRQDVPQAYRRDGTVYLTRTEVLRGQRTFYGPKCAALVLDPAESLTVDSPGDWAEAERRLGASQVAL
jgi:N-acylneuraminate cytidylyltransferase